MGSDTIFPAHHALNFSLTLPPPLRIRQRTLAHTYGVIHLVIFRHTFVILMPARIKRYRIKFSRTMIKAWLVRSAPASKAIKGGNEGLKLAVGLAKKGLLLSAKNALNFCVKA